MARKVFISFLGGTNYRYCDYQKNDRSYGNVRFIQEATLNYLNVNEEWSRDDVALILLTKGAEESNWRDNGQINEKTGELIRDEVTLGKLEGLESRLKQFDIQKKPVFNLPDGNDEKEIWTIFDKTFQQIHEGDELYFDITHGFRYLPMLVLVLCNYSRFLKKVKIRSITYGNYEVARSKGHGLIVDLLPLSQLQDWTYAAGTYLESGDADELVEMSEIGYSDFALLLKDTIADFHTCRGISIIESTKIKKIKSIMSSMDCLDVPPLKYVFDEVEKDFSNYDDYQNVKNGYESAKWCFRNHLYQQAITILIETVISDICICEGLEWKRRKMREMASNALFIVANNTPEKGWKIVSDTKDKDKYNPDYLEMLANDPESLNLIDERIKYKYKYYTDLMICRQVVNSQRTKDLVELSTMIKDVRDDLDHAGMRNGARTFAEIEELMRIIFEKLDSVM